MPNHLHLILPRESQDRDERKLTGILGGLGKKTKIRRIWQPIGGPVSIPDRYHLRRQVRYVALNPCRRGLCCDPLEWEWSSYRDIMGATTAPWISARRLSRTFSETEQGFRVRFHGYVSGDPSVAVQGTPPPKPAAPQQLAREPIFDILAAAAASLKVRETEILGRHELRRVFIHLAYRQGWGISRFLSEMCQVEPRSIQMILQKPAPDLTAAILCLGDKRLRGNAEKAKLTPDGRRP